MPCTAGYPLFRPLCYMFQRGLLWMERNLQGLKTLHSYYKTIYEQMAKLPIHAECHRERVGLIELSRMTDFYGALFVPRVSRPHPITSQGLGDVACRCP